MTTKVSAPNPQLSAVSKLIFNSGAKTTAEALPLEVLHNLRHQHGWKDLQLHTILPNSMSVPTTSPATFDRSVNNAMPINGLMDLTISPSSSASSTPTLKPIRSPTRSPNRSPVRSPLHISTTTVPEETVIPPPSISLPSNPSRFTSTSTTEPTLDFNQQSLTLISGFPPRHVYLHPDFQNELLKRKLDPLKDVSVIPIQREWVLPVSLGEKWSLKRICSVFDSLPEREVLVCSVGTNIVGGGAGRKGLEWKDAKRIVMGMVAKNGFGGDGTVVYYIVQEGEVKPRQNG